MRIHRQHLVRPQIIPMCPKSTQPLRSLASKGSPPWTTGVRVCFPRLIEDPRQVLGGTMDGEAHSVTPGNQQAETKGCVPKRFRLAR